MLYPERGLLTVAQVYSDLNYQPLGFVDKTIRLQDGFVTQTTVQTRNERSVRFADRAPKQYIAPAQPPDEVRSILFGVHTL